MSYFDNGSSYEGQEYTDYTQDYTQDWAAESQDQEGYYENYSHYQELKSADASVYDEPVGNDANQGGERVKKRAAEDDVEQDTTKKKAKGDQAAPPQDPDKNAVSELNHKIPGIEFKLVATGGVVHAPMFTMQVTIGGQVFEAEANTKKKARQIVAQSALNYLAENNISANDPVIRKAPKNPTVILNEIRPHSKYETIADREVDGKRVFTMQLKVEDETFDATAKSKSIAKALAASQALSKICGLEIEIPEDGTMPMYSGDDELWRKHKKPKLTILFEDQNPITMLHSMYRPLPFEMETLSEEPPEHKCTVQIENQHFVGHGATRQAAKATAAVEALTMLRNRGLLERKKAEAAAAREIRLAEMKAQKEAELAELKAIKEKEEQEKSGDAATEASS